MTPGGMAALPSLFDRAWRARARWVPALPALAALACAAVLFVDAHRYFTRPDPAVLNDFDEGYALALARRMIEGQWLPYVDGVSHRGPVFYWVVAIAAKVWGYDGWLSMRVLALLLLLANLLLGFLAAGLARRWTAGGILATGFASVCLGSMSSHDGMAANAELLVNVFALGAFVALALALRSLERKVALVWVFVAGALGMLGGLSKQVGLVALGPLGLWLACATLSRSSLPRRRRWLLVLVFAAGVITPAAVVLARYALAGELATFRYYFLTYNTEVYLGGIGHHSAAQFRLFWTRKLDLLIVAAPFVGLALVWVLGRTRSLRGLPRSFDAVGAEATIALEAVVALAIANAARRDFGHYYLQVLPWAGLFGGIVVERALAQLSFGSRRRWARATLLRLAVLAPATALSIAAWTVRLRQNQKDGHPGFQSSKWPVCEVVRAHSRADESLFIWGFEPANYTACNRRPASRYVYTTFVAGYVPFLAHTMEVEARLSAPGSKAILLRELQASDPAVVLDCPNSMGGRSMLHYPELERFLRAGYCRLDVDVGGPTPWVRKLAGRCPAR